MVGLANQLPVASLLLIQEDINAVVVTEFMPFKLSPQCPPLASFVEASLFCPLSMVSTMYGLRLANQLDLGSPVPIRCHDHLAVGSTKLQCKKTPNSFSTNMNSDTSTELIGIIKSMGRSCFIPVPNLGLGLRVIEGVLLRFGGYVAFTGGAMNYELFFFISGPSLRSFFGDVNV